MTAEMELHRRNHEQPSGSDVTLEQDVAAGLISSPVAPMLRTSISRHLIVSYTLIDTKG